MINKEIRESEDPESLDLFSIVTQARERGLTQEQKSAILKVSKMPSIKGAVSSILSVPLESEKTHLYRWKC